MDVLIGDLSAEAKKTGLTDEELRTDVELKLRLAGIKIEPKSLQYLYIDITFLLGETERYAFVVRVNFRQMVRLQRDPSILLVATTWSDGGIAMGPGGDLRDNCRAMVRDYVDKFVNAYLSVNPK